MADDAGVHRMAAPDDGDEVNECEDLPSPEIELGIDGKWPWSEQQFVRPYRTLIAAMTNATDAEAEDWLFRRMCAMKSLEIDERRRFEELDELNMYILNNRFEPRELGRINTQAGKYIANGEVKEPNWFGLVDYGVAVEMIETYDKLTHRTLARENRRLAEEYPKAGRLNYFIVGRMGCSIRKCILDGSPEVPFSFLMEDTGCAQKAVIRAGLNVLEACLWCYTEVEPDHVVRRCARYALDYMATKEGYEGYLRYLKRYEEEWLKVNNDLVKS